MARRRNATNVAGDTEHILSDPVVILDPDYSLEEKNDFNAHWDQITSEHNQRNVHLNGQHASTSKISSETCTGDVSGVPRCRTGLNTLHCYSLLRTVLLFLLPRVPV
jgi:hypothetical protein